MDDAFPSGMVEEIEAFLKDDDKRKPGEDIYPEVFDTNLFFPLQRRGELASMIRTAREIKPKVVMEIGSDKGGSLYHWAKCLPIVERLVACEIRGIPYAPIFERAFPHIKFHWLAESSYHPASVSRAQRLLEYAPIDVLFIDGDKAGMLRDFNAYLPLMNPKGVVFWHDIQDGMPRTQYDEACRQSKCHHDEIVDMTDLLYVQGKNIRTPHANWLRHWNGASCGLGIIHLSKKL